MTAAEMKTEFLVGYDKITNFAAPGYTDSEISKFLNDSQERFLKKNYGDLNKYRTSYEETEKRSKDLSELKRFSTISTFTAGNHPNSFFAELPENIVWATKEEVEINITDCHGDTSTKRVGVFPVSDDYYNVNIENPFKKPDATVVWRMDFSRTDDTQVVSSTNSKRHELVTDGSTINKYYLTYLKYPQTIDVTNSVDCELDPSVHKEIVEMAISIALETSQEPRYQTQKQEEQFLE
jgi:hypothetical protein